MTPAALSGFMFLVAPAGCGGDLDCGTRASVRVPDGAYRTLPVDDAPPGVSSGAGVFSENEFVFEYGESPSARWRVRAGVHQDYLWEPRHDLSGCQLAPRAVEIRGIDVLGSAPVPQHATEYWESLQWSRGSHSAPDVFQLLDMPVSLGDPVEDIDALVVIGFEPAP